MTHGRGGWYGPSPLRLVQAAAAQVVSDDDVSDGVEYELDIVGVGSTCHVTVDLLGGGFVLGFELRLDVCGRFAVFLRACKSRYLNFVDIFFISNSFCTVL